jgi:SAM-dependent methyltransferase
MDNEKLVLHYQELLSKHGNTAKTLQHFDEYSQGERFRILTSVIDVMSFSVLDVGCGLGHLASFLNNTKKKFNYLGTDIVPEFVSLSKENFKSYPNIQFEHKDVFETDQMNGDNLYDYVIMCGIFNNKMDDNWIFLTEALQKAYKMANKAVAVNLLSTYVDYQDKDLYYCDPLQIFDYCKKSVSKKVSLRHDYIVKKGSVPYEYTIYLYK